MYIGQSADNVYYYFYTFVSLYVKVFFFRLFHCSLSFNIFILENFFYFLSVFISIFFKEIEGNCDAFL